MGSISNNGKEEVFRDKTFCIHTALRSKILIFANQKRFQKRERSLLLEFCSKCCNTRLQFWSLSSARECLSMQRGAKAVIFKCLKFLNLTFYIFLILQCWLGCTKMHESQNSRWRSPKVRSST